MRQGQQNRRGRGRNRSKGQNPLTRSFESSGPDVKIRGTPAHIAEKYISYARDAQSSGDPVLAENYLQHAEHYNRIIMAYREQNAHLGPDGLNGNGMRPQPGSGEFQEYGGDGGDDEYYENGMDPFRPTQRAYQPQPEGEPQPRHDNEQRRQQPPHHQHQRNQRPNRQRSDRQPGMDRGQDRGHDRQQGPGGDQGRRPQQQFAAPDEPAGGNGGSREAPPRLAHDEQPEFLRRPVRRPRREAAPDQDQPAGFTGNGDTAEEAVD